ncbi:GNAT family N-acetyltransferase [uncultured Paracoccus sp.]|uniref:GNAT family N-acetyltransferase n=1 Tax=uncultured Paracoccus sp. TaxID=189685 RepID=UPI00262DFEB7|nr:GNAT family N-acetyltransferase [uncultured Paracoccus sp.]
MTGGIVLDRLGEADAPLIAGALADLDTTQWLSSVPFPYGLADARKFIAEAGPDDHAIRVNGALAGGVRSGGDLGYWVLPAFRRQGVARRAAVLALTRSFAAGHQQVTASYLQGNTASAAVLDVLGFGDPHPGTVYSVRLGRDVPATRVTLTRAAFAARHGVSIETGRLVINRAEPADLPALYDIATRPDVAQMLFIFRRGMKMADFAPIFPAESLVPPYRLAIRHAGRVIGSIGIGRLDGKDAPPIYYFLSPDSWGQGFGREILQAFLAEIDARYAPPHLEAEVFSDNPASARMLEGVGFQRTGEVMLWSAGRGGKAPGWAYRRDRG